MDAELQQRAVEYGGLATRPAVAKQNVLPMPRWEHRKSLLMRRLAEKQVGSCMLATTLHRRAASMSCASPPGITLQHTDLTYGQLDLHQRCRSLSQRTVDLMTACETRPEPVLNAEAVHKLFRRLSVDKNEHPVSASACRKASFALTVAKPSADP